MKIPVLPLLAVAALGFAVISISRTQPVHPLADPPSAPPVSPYAHAIGAVGLVEPPGEAIAIGTHLPGVVERVEVVAGQTVAAGAPLFRIDPRPYASTLAVREAAAKAAEAAVRTAQALLADAKAQQAHVQKLADQRSIATEEVIRRRYALDEASARYDEARAVAERAQAEVRDARTELERTTVRAPLDAVVLAVNLRAGEFAPAGVPAEPLLVLGARGALQVRVDIDEHEGWKLDPQRPAVARLRGNATISSPLTWVRTEPLAVPKRSLTGATTERVDTRVVQAIYRIENAGFPVRVGQQLDVYVETAAPDIPGTAAEVRP